jgi:CHAT domain-containing protein
LARELEAKSRRIHIPDFIAVSLMRQADILVAANRDNEAIVSLIEARRELGDLRKHDLEVRILAKLATIQGRQRDWPTLSSTSQQGIELIERFRYKVNGPYLQSAYLRSRIGLYSLGVRSAYEMKDFKLMLERAELSKCRSALRHQPSQSSGESLEQIEQLFQAVCRQIDSAQAENREHEELLFKRRLIWDRLMIERFQAGSKGNLPDFSLEAVQSLLDSDEASIYYYWIDNQNLLVVTIDQNRFIAELKSVSEKERTELDEFARYVLEFSKSSTFSYLERVTRFSSLLLPQQGSSILQDKKRLLVSPHKLLHAVPFHALEWEGDFLIKLFAITYVPNLSSLLIRYASNNRHEVLALGIHEYDVMGAALGPLEEAEREVDDLQKTYNERAIPITVLKGGEATESRLQELQTEGKLSEFTCLHFATHGNNINSDTPMESFLYLRSSKLDGLEIANWKLNADLVVLSACCSGQRPISGRGMQDLPGDEIFGLQAAFFTAGAKRILSTLWPVNSPVACEIITGFHRHIASGKLPELALQDAVKDYLNAATLKRKLVYYWAPFFLSALGRPAINNH